MIKTKGIVPSSVFKQVSRQTGPWSGWCLSDNHGCLCLLFSCCILRFLPNLWWHSRPKEWFPPELALHLAIQKCDEKSVFKIWLLMDLGAINLLFLYRKPSMQEISFLKLQYFPTSCGTFTLFSGHLFWVMLLRFCSSGSSDACFLNWSYYSVVNASDLLRFQVPSLHSFLVRKLCYVCVPKTLFFLPWK